MISTENSQLTYAGLYFETGQDYSKEVQVVSLLLMTVNYVIANQ